jgi:hypothetical protein
MPAISIEQAMRTMLTTNIASPADANITHGYRPQDSTLPAITYAIDSTETAAIAGDLYMTQATITAIDTTTLSVANLQATVKSACIAGTYSLYFRAVVVTGQSIQPETVGFGDEQEPAQGTTNIIIFWSTS